MRLKHLRLHGYKTFAGKTEFVFPSGITAVVGPNGSGKSNIADAIRWVLGEQSYTTLRGKRTEDMIFSGGESRARAGMAEVVLTLDNQDGWLPVDFTEVTISRRAYRDGQNEYSINNSRVRLRDITELLSQSGLSRRTYTIIGQGLVDTVLSLRAQERRELFEEAAGIAHYQDQRAEALRKLDETGHNLERAQDILAEIEPRLKRLRRQAERAEEHKELSVELEQLLRVWYGYRWKQATTALDKAQQMTHEQSRQQEKRLQELQNLVDKIDQVRQAQTELRNQLGDWHRQSSIFHTQAEGSQRELAVLGERSRQLAAQREEHLAEIGALGARLEAHFQRLDEAQAEATRARALMAEQERKAQASQAGYEQRLSERQELLQRQQAALQQQAQLHTEIANRQSRMEAQQERVAALISQREEHHMELTRLDEELGRQSRQVKGTEAQLEQVAGELERARNARVRVEEQRQALAEQSDSQENHWRQLREQEAQVAARFDLLGQLRRDLAVYGEPARTLLAGAGSQAKASPVTGLHGVLAQMIEVTTLEGADLPGLAAGAHGPLSGVPPGVEETELTSAVEAALGAYAGAIVVDNWQAAAAALRHLETARVPGRVIFLTLEPPTGREQTEEHQRSRRGPNGTAGVPRPLVDYIRTKPVVRPLLRRLLGNAYLVPDLGAGVSILRELPEGSTAVTARGEVVRKHGTIEGGQPGKQTTPLTQEREWAQLNAQRVDLGARREETETALHETRKTLEKAQRELAEADLAIDDLNDRYVATRAIHDQLQGQVARLAQAFEWRQAQLSSAEGDYKELQGRQEMLRREIVTLGEALTAIAASIEELKTRLDALPIEPLSQALTADQMRLAALREMCEGKESILRELQAGQDHLKQERHARERRVADLENEISRVAERVQRLAGDQAGLTGSLEALNAQIEPAEKRLVGLEKEQKQLEAEERVQRARLREFENHLTRTRLALQRREDEVAQLRSRIEEDLGLVELEMRPSMLAQTPLPLHPLVSKLKAVDQLPDGLEDEIRRLRAQLHRLGGVNPDAPAEYKEVQERYEFLQEQSADLYAASDSLREIIAEVDGLIEHAFRETFDAVAVEFGKNFKALFDGGQARLELTEPDNLTQTGIEIVAQPPGKRLQALASLSGGERALTAVALIFAILKVSPTPFCILDEVDATLDEANVGRFRTMLESLTERTQFILITHNRGTISAADTVYGVSMGADSASQVVSIRMEGERIKEA